MRITIYNKVFLMIVFYLSFVSCNPTKNGEIKKGSVCKNIDNYWLVADDAHSQGLINKSKTKIIFFTVKEIEIISDHGDVGTSSETVIYKLNPGEEEELYCEKYVSRNDKQNWNQYKYEIVGAVVERE